MNAIDQVLTGYGWQNGDLEQARSELTQLRATIVKQAAQLEQAKEAISDALDTMELEGVGHGNTGRLCRTWLSTYDAQHAQAAQLEQAQTAIREARQQLRATQENWREDCLYRADDILSAALGEEAQHAQAQQA